MRAVGVALLLLLASGTAGWAAEAGARAVSQSQSCGMADLLPGLVSRHFSADIGRSAPRQELAGLPIASNAVVRKWESGESANTYLVFEGESPYVLKKFRDPGMASRDLARLEALERLGLPAQVIKARLVKPGLLRMPWVPGRTVDQVLADEAVSAEARALVRKRFEALTEKLDEGLRRPELSPLTIFVDEENVLVDPKTLKLTIIDPL